MTTTETPPADDRLLRHGWRSRLTLYAAWTLPAVVTGLTSFAIQRAADESVELGRILFQQLWYFWALATLSPAIYLLNARFPFRRGGIGAALAAHAIAGGVIGFGLMIANAVVDVLVGTRGLAIPDAIVAELTTPRGQFRGLVNVFYYVVLVGAMALILVSRERRTQEERAAELAVRASRLETQVVRARLEALEMQLNPHFLFNALNGIASLVEQRRNDDAYRGIALLGELLRETLRAGERSAVDLTHEMDLLEKYLGLERLRFSERLETDIRLGGDCAAAIVPALILQPLVENAVCHGLANQPGRCRISIYAERQGANVLLEVRDDGPGLPAGWSLDRDAGVGLGNVRQRLEALYGKGAELSVVDRAGGGVSARIRLPFHEAGSGPRETA